MHAARRDAVGLVEGDLLVAAPLGFAHGRAHGIGDPVGIKNRLAAQVAGCAADGLDQAALAAQEAFLVRVEDGDERNLGNVQAFAQEVDAYQHVESAQAQIAQDLHTLNRVHVRVQIADLDAVVAQVIR